MPLCFQNCLILQILIKNLKRDFLMDNMHRKNNEKAFDRRVDKELCTKRSVH